MFDLLKLNAPLVAGGQVLDFAISPDGQRVVYRADQETDELVELWSVPIGGGTPVKINGALLAGEDVESFAISPDSSTVVYWTERLLAAPIGGGASVQLDSVQPTAGDRYLISPDSTEVGYDAGDAVCRTQIGGGLPACFNPVLPPGVVFGPFAFSPDSEWMLFKSFIPADEFTPPFFQLHSTGPGGGDVLGAAEFGVSVGGITSDSEQVLYREEFGSSQFLKSRPLEGGPYENVCGALSGVQVDSWALTGGEVSGSYRAACALSGATSGIYSGPLDGGPPTFLGVGVGPVRITPDDSTVVFDRGPELRSIPLLGGLSTPLTSTDAWVDVKEFAITPDGESVVLVSDEEVDGSFALRTAPTDGEYIRLLSPPMGAGADEEPRFELGPLFRLALFRAEQEGPGQLDLYSVPLDGGVPRRLSENLFPGAQVQGYSITPDGTHAVFRASESDTVTHELFVVRLTTDGDGDGVLDVCDCAVDDVDSWDLPPRLDGLLLSHEGGPGGTTTLSWNAASTFGGVSVGYDTLRTDVPNGFDTGSGATVEIVDEDGTDTLSTDGDDPPVIYYYVVRAGNSCGEGPTGR